MPSPRRLALPLFCLAFALLLAWGCSEIESVDVEKTDTNAVDAGQVSQDGAGPGPDIWAFGPKVHIRVVAANLSSGKYQSYDQGHGRRILQGLKPDIVLIQEFNYGAKSVQAMDEFVGIAFGEQFEWFREPKGTIPNGVISRWPIIKAGYWEDTQSPNREFSWARIDIPGPRDLWAISVHLLTAKASTRTKQVTALLNEVEAMVPVSDFLVIGGDLNTNTPNEGCFDLLDKVVSRAHLPRDQDGNRNTNADRTRPYDWLLPDKDLEVFHDSVRLGGSVYPDGLVFDSRVYTPLTDVAPVEAADSAASGMQHMAVVRDFEVPGDWVP